MPTSPASPASAPAPTPRRGVGVQEGVLSSLFGLAYYRVSTSRQANTSFDEDGFSIQAQREYCQRKAAELGVQLVDEYVDRGKSARSADRPGLQAMLARVKDDTDIQYVFVHKLDRLARNRADDVQIGLLLAKHGVRLVSCTENIDDTPSGKLVRGIMGDIAEWYSANLSEEAKKGMRKKVESGGTPGKAPLGYINARHKIVELGKDIGVVEVDEVRAPIITECFKLYDSGHCTLSDVAEHANNRGLHLPANKRLPDRPLTTQSMQRILRNRYYTGRICFDGVEYPGDHPPLIDDATFERVQALLTARDLNKDKSRKRPHHLKGVLYCAQCGRRLGITVVAKQRSGQVVTYPYFFCLGRQVDKNNCPQSHMPIGDVEDAVREYCAHLRLPTERLRALRAAILANFTGKHEQGQHEIEQQKRRIVDLQQRHQKAKAAYFGGALNLEEFKGEQEAIRRSIRAAEEIIAQWSVELESITQALDDALRLVENPQALYDALPEGMRAVFMQSVFAKLWVMDSRVMGSELTDTFAELLTVEARLVATQQASADEASTTVTIVAPKAHGDGVVTHYRQREVIPAWLQEAIPAAGRPFIERPYGRLPIDIKYSDLLRGRSSKIQHLVHLTRSNLNLQLITYIKEHPSLSTRQARRKQDGMYRSSGWRLRDRLSEKDINELVVAFKSGTAKHVLAERYGINIKSMKRLLREQDVKRKSRWDIHPEEEP